MGTKNNPGKFDCYDAAEPNEPMFTLLARDRSAPQLIREWADMRRELAQFKGTWTTAEREKIQEAYDCADAMDKWRSTNRPEQP